MAARESIRGVPKRHEVEEFAATAVIFKGYGRMLFWHEREEFARRLAARRAGDRYEAFRSHSA